jgi:glycosyltransferase involved in cell wall biosynthesis
MRTASVDKAPSSILVIDHPSRGGMHAAFNACYLRILRHAYPQARLTICAHASHNEELQKEISDLDNTAWLERRDLYDNGGIVPPFRSHLQRLKAVLVGAHRSNVGIKDAAKRSDADLIIVICPAPLTVGALRFLKLPKPAPIHLVLFGQLKTAKKDAQRHAIWAALSFKNEIRLGARKTVTFICLEKHVESALHAYMGHDKTRTYHLEHPIPQPLAPLPKAQPREDTRSPTKFGFLGMAVPVKGFPDFVAAAHALRGPDVEFHAIGHSVGGLEGLNLSALKTPPGRDKVPQDAFIAGLQAMDAIVQPLSAAYADYSSGTILDAVAYEKPLFALTNSLMDWLEQRGMPIGHMAPDMDGLIAAMRAFADGKMRKEAKQWRKNQQAFKAERALPALAEKYKRYIEAG